MKKIINHREGECFGCKVKSKKKEFIKRKGIFICYRCGYYNSESIFKEYKEIENQQLVFGVDTQESIKNLLKINLKNERKLTRNTRTSTRTISKSSSKIINKDYL